MFKIYYYNLVLCFVLLLSACNQPASLTQEQLGAFASDLQLNYQVLSNFQSEESCQGKSPCFSAQLTFSVNNNFADKNWAIFFSHTRPVFWSSSDDFNLEHINGDLHKITPKQNFRGFEHNRSYQLQLKAEGWFVAETDVMPNYYITAEGLKPQSIIASQSLQQKGSELAYQPHAMPFSKPEQYLRKVDDKLELATPVNTFVRNQQINAANSYAPLRIIPKVLSQQSNGQYLNLQAGINPVTELTRDYSAAFELLATTGIKTSPTGVAVELLWNEKLANEAYTLTIGENGIAITASSKPGVFYALMSISQLYRQKSQSLPQTHIVDEPRYAFRGLHLDLARNFQPLATIKQIMGQMAWLKMNKLHLHLADDEGWRLQIKDLPELTQIGAYRCHDLTERQCLLPQLASGPERNSPVNGFYTEQQYIELLELARELNIEVIPSLDMPGHARAAVKAMLARYHRLMQQEKKAEAEEFLLTDLQDSSQYRSIQYYNDNTINPCIDSSYHFIQTVITRVQSMHQQAQHPLKRYHIGADETAGAWSASPACQKLTSHRPELDSAEKLTGYFIERVATMISGMGVIPAGWSDGMSHVDSSKLMGIAQANVWSTLDHNAAELTHSFSNKGWDTVLSLPEVLYFDFPYAVDPKEPGYYWASRQTDSYQVFEFMPDNLPAHQHLWRDNWGQRLNVADPTKRLPQINVSGIQAQLWSELVRSPEIMQYMLFPRLAAVAERAWHQAAWEPDYWQHQGKLNAEQQQLKAQDWQGYSQHLVRRLLPVWQQSGIMFRLPLPGAKITVENEGKKLELNNLYQGLQLEYQLPGKPWQQYQSPIALTENMTQIKLRSRLDGMQRHSRIIEVTTDELQ